MPPNWQANSPTIYEDKDARIGECLREIQRLEKVNEQLLKIIEKQRNTNKNRKKDWRPK